MFRAAIRWLRRPLGISVALHVAAFACLMAYAPRFRSSTPANGDVAAAQSAAPASRPEKDGGEAKSVTETVAANIVDRIGESFADAKALPAEKQLETALSRATQLEKISSVKSMHEISDVVQRTMGTAKRAYKPAAKPPAGPFNHDDSLVYSVVRRPNKSGVVVPWFVLVDRDGRTVQVEVGPGESTMATVMERLHSSEILREFKDGILLPILDQHLPKKPAPE